MANALIDTADNLATIDYTQLLQKLTQYLPNIKLETSHNYTQISNLHNTINDIISDLKSEFVTTSKILNIDFTKRPNHLSINYQDYANFSADIKKLYDKLQIDSIDVHQLSKLDSIKKNPKVAINFGVDYTFSPQNLAKKSMEFTSNKVNTIERLRVDSVQIKINTKEVEQQFKENIINQLCNYIDDEEDLEDKIEAVQQGKSNVNNVISSINNDCLARIKRTISYLYMEYLLEDFQYAKNYKFAHNYVRRFKMLEQYLQELRLLPERDGTISIGQCSYNLCDLLYEGNAFDSLPVIGKVDGTMLENTEDGFKTFKIALKMKLNGSVQKNEGSVSSLEYHLKNIINDQVDPKKRLRTFFLYTFLLHKLDDDNYDPIKNWKVIKSKLNTETISPILNQFVNSFTKRSLGDKNGKDIVADITKLFTEISKTKVSTLQTTSKLYNRNLTMLKGVLEPNLEGQHIFRPVKYDKEYLKYVSIVENSLDETIRLLDVALTFTINSTSLYENSNLEQTGLQYATKELNILPIILVPEINNFSRLNNLWETLNNVYHIRISYPPKLNTENEDGYLYTICYTTLVYMSIDKLLKNIENKKDVYIPILRVHSCKQQLQAPHIGEYVRDIGKTLEHMLGDKYRSMSQGFIYDRKDKYLKNIYLNAISSMYSRVPKSFNLSNVPITDNTAIIVVTGRKCDNTEQSEVSLLLGEVILFRTDNNSIVCDDYKTFCDSYKNTEIYETPNVLADIVNEIYAKGYKKIIYISKAPYSNKLNITSDRDNLYFMNKSIIQMIQKPDLEIYPIYFEQYYSIDYNIATRQQGALYISETDEIGQHLDTNNKTVAGVFNLYSGRSVGRTSDSKELKYYKGVILYLTFCNMYNEQTNKNIREALINKSELKNWITEVLTMLHYSRYEANGNITIKTNPYDRLLGDDGVSARSVFTFRIENRYNLKFNALAYLREIKRLLI
ncbi:MAG: hypothetical protein ATN35_04895 [Epulopiscium sp. Nele67-Bin004]|nr:MAG: hypothetical protein ATN35_04895 [Epulopiscium sp. Nele67-Bin004]